MKPETKTKIAFVALVLFVLFQVLLTGVYIYDLLSSRFNFSGDPLPWEVLEILQLSGGFALILGVGVGLYVIWRLYRRINKLDSRLRVASSAFEQLLDDEFDNWNLSPKERDVGIFILKGLSNAEISEVTGKKEGTVKAQTNAIFKKAGFTSRSQFTSYFFEVLLQVPLIDDKQD